MFVINFIGRKSNKMMLKKTINKALSFLGAKVLRMSVKKLGIVFYFAISFLQVVMPKQKSGSRAVRTPSFCVGFHGLFRIDAEQFLDGIDHGNVAKRNNIGCRKAEHQVHINRPVADSFEFDEFGAHGFRRFFGKAFQVYFFVDDCS